MQLQLSVFSFLEFDNFLQPSFKLTKSIALHPIQSPKVFSRFLVYVTVVFTFFIPEQFLLFSPSCNLQRLPHSNIVPFIVSTVTITLVVFPSQNLFSVLSTWLPSTFEARAKAAFVFNEKPRAMITAVIFYAKFGDFPRFGTHLFLV